MGRIRQRTRIRVRISGRAASTFFTTYLLAPRLSEPVPWGVWWSCVGGQTRSCRLPALRRAPTGRPALSATREPGTRVQMHRER